MSKHMLLTLYIYKSYKTFTFFTAIHFSHHLPSIHLQSIQSLMAQPTDRFITLDRIAKYPRCYSVRAILVNTTKIPKVNSWQYTQLSICHVLFFYECLGFCENCQEISRRLSARLLYVTF